MVQILCVSCRAGTTARAAPTCPRLRHLRNGPAAAGDADVVDVARRRAVRSLYVRRAGHLCRRRPAASGRLCLARRRQGQGDREPAAAARAGGGARPADLRRRCYACLCSNACLCRRVDYAGPPGRTTITDRIRREVLQGREWDLSTVPVEPDEEAKLLANGVDELDARRYLVWRRSVLLVVTIPTLVSAVLATLAFLGQDRSGYSGLGILLELGRLGALFALPATPGSPPNAGTITAVRAPSCCAAGWSPSSGRSFLPCSRSAGGSISAMAIRR